jgi:ankyrin repeat protein
MLIKAGANVNVVFNGDTALHLAVRSRNNEVVKLLLENGFKPTAADADGKTALQIAATSGQDRLVKLILDKGGGGITRKGFNVDVALRQAATNGHDGVVKLLLEYGANPATVDTEGRTPLHLAASNGHESSVKLLLDKDSINKKDSYGDVPLFLAARDDHTAVAKFLLQNGAYLAHSCGITLLRAAIRMKDQPLVELLLEREVDVNAKDPMGQTILQLALLKGTGDIVRLLREHGAETTTDPHFTRMWRGLMNSEDVWKYTTNPTAGWD